MAINLASHATQARAELSEAELRAALAIGGLRPTGQSPLVRENGEFFLPSADPHDPAVIESLYRKGLLAVSLRPTLLSDWQQALQALSDPLWDLSMIVGSRARLQYDRYFAARDLTGDSLVYYQSADSMHLIAHPYGPQFILGVLDQAIHFATPGGAGDMGAELNYKEYMVLTALLDVFRRRVLRKVLGRKGEVRRDVTPEEVDEVLREGIREAEPQWLVTLGNTVSPLEFDLDRGEVKQLLEALGLRGYMSITEDGTEMAASDVLLDMADSLLLVPSFAAFELTFIKSAETFEINYFAAVRGLDVIWLFDFYELATPFPRVSVATVSGEELGLMLQGLMEESQEKTARLLRSRQASPGRPPELRRLPSPPTLRSLKVPGTAGRLRPGIASGPDRAADGAGVSDEEVASTLSPETCQAHREVIEPPSPPLPSNDPTVDRVAVPGEERELEASPSTSPLLEERPCPHCGLPVLTSKKYCRHCGKSQNPQDVAPLGPPPVGPAISTSSTPCLEEALPNPPPGPSPLTCKICGLALADTARFCGHCGANVIIFRPPGTLQEERRCPSCSGKIAPNARFCAFCGYRVPS